MDTHLTNSYQGGNGNFRTSSDASAPECYDTLVTGILLCWREWEHGHGTTTGDADKTGLGYAQGTVACSIFAG